MNPFYFSVLIVLIYVISWSCVSTQGINCQTPDRKGGECISIRECPVLLSLLNRERPIPWKTLQYLRESNCGFDGSDPLVCCPTNVGWATTPFPPYTQTNYHQPTDVSFRDVSYHPQLGLLPDYCGVLGEDNKITNGDVPGLFEYPWMALLGFRSRQGLIFRCGGTLINRRYVLTASHCLTSPSDKPILVRLGEFDLRREVDCEDSLCAPAVQDIRIEELIIHPEYATDSINHDIGLLRLRRNAVYNEAVGPICLPIGRDQQLRNLDGLKVTVTGWGRTEDGINSAVLLKANIPVVPLERCIALYNASVQLNSRHLCAGGTGGKDSCSGDSGGPLQTLATKDGRPVYVQYGIVVAGPRSCGTDGWPGLYIKVGYYMQWILDTIRP